jgi:predicted ATPase
MNGERAPASESPIYAFGRTEKTRGWRSRRVWTRRPQTLPAPLASLVGRERELTAGAAILSARQVRLVTLTGAPGSGKTRLAVALGHALAESFPEGVWFVPLGPLDRHELVLPTIAQFLEIRQLGRRPLLEGLAQALWGQRMLLILDNFEHVLAAAPQVVELLSACPDMSVLVTSRAPLHVSGEHQFPVSLLAVPRLDRLPPLDALSQVPSVRLFIDRACAARPDFTLSDVNAAAIAELCVQLDGLPLAIELAAARTGVLEPWDALARVGGRVSLLADGPRDLPARQRTLRAAIAWSYDLLSQDEQRVFRGLSVFAGGCTLEAAQSVVCGPEEQTLDAIATLLDRSLLQKEAQTGGGVRVSMLETLREYAHYELIANREFDEISHRHADFFLALRDGVANPRLDEPDGPILLARLDREHDNLRAALRWLQEHDDSDGFVRLAGALWAFWSMRGHWSEGLRWLKAALALGRTAAAAARARALIGAAALHRCRSEYAAASAMARESTDLYREVGDESALATALNILADAVALGGDPPAASRFIDETIAIRHKRGEPLGVVWSQLVAGYVAAYQGDFAAARAHYEAGLSLRRGQSGNEVDGQLLHGLGTIFAGADEFGSARPMLEQALTIFRQRGDSRGTARVLLPLGGLLTMHGEVAAGRAQLEESLAMFRELGEGVGVALCSLLIGLPLPGRHACGDRRNRSDDVVEGQSGPRRSVTEGTPALASRNRIGSSQRGSAGRRSGWTDAARNRNSAVAGATLHEP